jgi:hypothetical protein
MEQPHPIVHRHFEPPFLAHLRASLRLRSMGEQALVNQFLHDVYSRELRVMDLELDPLELFDALGHDVVAMFNASCLPVGPRVINATMLDTWRYPLTPALWDTLTDVIEVSLEALVDEEHVNPLYVGHPAGYRATVLLAIDKQDKERGLWTTFLAHNTMSALAGLTLLASAADECHRLYHPRRPAIQRSVYT